MLVCQGHISIFSIILISNMQNPALCCHQYDVTYLHIILPLVVQHYGCCQVVLFLARHLLQLSFICLEYLIYYYFLVIIYTFYFIILLFHYFIIFHNLINYLFHFTSFGLYSSVYFAFITSFYLFFRFLCFPFQF